MRKFWLTIVLILAMFDLLAILGIVAFKQGLLPAGKVTKSLSQVKTKKIPSDCNVSLRLSPIHQKQVINCGLYSTSDSKLINSYIGKLADVVTKDRKVYLQVDFGKEEQLFYLGKAGRDEVVLIEVSGELIFPDSAHMQQILTFLDDSGIQKIRAYQDQFIRLDVETEDEKKIESMNIYK